MEIPLEISEELRKGLEEAVRHCLIHNTLLYTPKISLEIQKSIVEAVEEKQKVVSMR